MCHREHLRVFRWFVVSFGHAHHHYAQILSQLPCGGTDQVADVFDYQEIKARLEIYFREGVADHMRLQVAGAACIDLNGGRASSFHALSVLTGLDIAFDHANNQAVAQAFDGAF